MTKKKIAQAPKSTKRPARNREEQPLPEGLVERAAERAGYQPTIPPPLSPEARIAGEERDRVTAALGPRLRRISDILAERIAVASDNLDFEVMHDLAEALSDTWHIRWELGVLPTRDDDDDEQMAEVAS